MIIFPEMEIRIIDRDKILKGILIINFKVPRSYIIFSSGLAVPDEDETLSQSQQYLQSQKFIRCLADYKLM